MTARPLGRRPAGGDTREEILESARSLFARVGYERTSIRAVAAGAGVDPAMIHHYFGNKDGLLLAAVTLPADPAVVLAGIADDPGSAGAEIIRRLLRLWEDPVARERMLGLIRAAMSHERAAAAMRDLLARTVLAELAQVVTDDTAELRAALIGSQVAGLLLGRYILQLPALAEAPAPVLEAAVGPVIQRYVTEPLGVPA